MQGIGSFSKLKQKSAFFESTWKKSRKNVSVFQEFILMTFFFASHFKANGKQIEKNKTTSQMIPDFVIVIHFCLFVV